MASGTPEAQIVLSRTGQVSFSVIKAARGRTARMNRLTALTRSSGT
jgi:hypothetical protein